jgi:hypothetical protein
MLVTVYGLGGHDPSKPNNNIVEVYDDGQPDPPTPDVDALAAALASLPTATLDALKQALGIGEI